MASPTHSIASGRTTPSERIPQATFQKQHTNGKETNIQVVVRCRGRNDREQREGQAIVVDTPCVTGREIKVNSEVSRKYTFDRVFGPEATQETVYDDIVAPILKEVLDGYNCTIFAYGQTGTGKTYTMEGDLEDVEGYHAGIIPRTMDRLFQLLDPDVPEYSVKLSYSELYNEELRDLLSPFNDDRKLTIYKETSGLRRVIIQGLEEVTVASAQDGISWLKKGSKKRQVAATKCNENSSRSHAIFSITVHVKEMTLDGEEVLKVGKLNLVDLAGSESIGRSGAENKRAREAGNINKSFDSNLTRLLQDSLGGRTKTCIIATISPAKNAREETLSTLDYARRAKNIRNKPEVNQRMTKQMLIKEYIVEIDRLKAALLATQEKNGIYLAQRDYQQMVSDNSTYKERLAEQRKTIENIEAELRQAEEQFLQQMRLFNETKRILQVTEQNLKESRETLERTEIDLRNTKQNLTEQEVLTAAHAATEERLNTVALILEEQHMATASQIQSFVQMRTAELKTNTFDHMNRHSTLNYGGSIINRSRTKYTRIDTQSKTMETEFIQHIDSMSTFVKDIRSIGGDLQQQALQRAEISRETFNALFNQLKSEVSKLQEQSKAHNATLHDNITSLYDLMAQQLKTQNDAFMSIISALSQEVVNEQRRSNKYLEQLNQIAKKEQETAREAQQAVISSVVQLLTNFTNGHEHSIQNMLTAVQDTHTQSSDDILYYLALILRRAFVEEQVEIVTKANDNIETCRTELQDKLGMTTKQLDTIEQQTGTSIGHIHQAGDDVEMVVNDMQQQYLETIDANVNNMETKSVKANTQLDLFKEPHRVAIHDIVQHSQQGHTAWTRDMHRLDDTSVALTKDSTKRLIVTGIQWQYSGNSGNNSSNNNNNSSNNNNNKSSDSGNKSSSGGGNKSASNSAPQPSLIDSSPDSNRAPATSPAWGHVEVATAERQQTAVITMSASMLLVAGVAIWQF
ncbi:P-loop containing nucleoside triphosphate hydrolase protein [Syncephalis plumigaleata]|nr:P-loop containing nucleoside triphosphate hydrolase protein [Syncephalis plumigaleata]